MDQSRKIHSDFNQGRKNLSKAVDRALNFSYRNSKSKSSHAREFWASVIFTKMLLSCMSLLRMLPHPNDKFSFPHWDFSSVASLSRNISESYLLFYYLCVEELKDESEWQFRLLSMRIKESRTRVKMMRSADPNFNSSEYDDQIFGIIKELEQNSYFQSQTQKRKKEIILGNKGLFLQDEVLVKIGLDQGLFRQTYIYQSSHVHSLPMSFFRNYLYQRADGAENDFDKQDMAMSAYLSEFFLARATTEYKQISKKALLLKKINPLKIQS